MPQEFEFKSDFEKLQEAVEYLIHLPDEKIGTIVIDSITDL